MYGNQVTGTLAAAVLGVGTAAATPASKSAKAVGTHVASQLATTGTSSTIALTVLAVLLLVAGMLMVTLTRRHAHMNG